MAFLESAFSLSLSLSLRGVIKNLFFPLGGSLAKEIGLAALKLRGRGHTQPLVLYSCQRMLWRVQWGAGQGLPSQTSPERRGVRSSDSTRAWLERNKKDKKQDRAGFFRQASTPVRG